MKICIVSHEYPPNIISGPGRYAKNLVEELVSKGNKVTVITPSLMGGKKHEKNGTLEVYRIKVAKSDNIFEKILPNLLDVRIMFSFKLRKFAEKFDFSRFDVLHILDMHDSYFLNEKIKKQTKVIISANDYYSLETSWNPFKFPYLCTDLPLRYVHYNYTKVMNSRYLRKADLVVSDTKYTANAINRVAKVPKSKIKVVYKGVAVDKFTKVPITKGKYHSHNILYIGSNMERKGVIDILKALPSVTKKYPDTKLTLIGRCSWLFKKKMNRIIRKNKMNKNIEHIWYCKPDDVPEYYSRANVFALTPVIEDLAQVLLEAMATSTPAVCTNVGANPEGIVNGLTGILVPPRNPTSVAKAILKLFGNPQLAKELGANGKKRALNIFNAPRMFRETLKVYENV